MILADTSAWIEYLRDRDQTVADALEAHLDDGALLITEPVVLEADVFADGHERLGAPEAHRVAHHREAHHREARVGEEELHRRALGVHPRRAVRHARLELAHDPGEALERLVGLRRPEGHHADLPVLPQRLAPRRDHLAAAVELPEPERAHHRVPGPAARVRGLGDGAVHLRHPRLGRASRAEVDHRATGVGGVGEGAAA